MSDKEPKLNNNPIDSINEEDNEVFKQLSELTTVKKSLDAAPTYLPKTWQEQEAYYNDELYKYIDNAWVNITGTTYSFDSPLSESGGTVSLGTVPVNKGGTNITSYSTGDILYASG